MRSFSALGRLAAWFSSRPVYRRPAARRRPRLELLERRDVPATITWTGLAASTTADTSWSNPLNWLQDTVPGASDTALFTKSNQVKAFTAVVDKAFTVAGVQVDATWAGAIVVNQALMITQGLSLGSGTFGGDGAISLGGASTWSAPATL
ncbi:MAG TPA: hypothetical protein VFD32_10860, partial [Dehalococcoidia bacterium]|nr:hypothetical protein [Dehalococcoidia bacterium]